FPYLQSRLYLENRRSFATYMTVVARGADAAAVISGTETIVRSIDRHALVSNAATMEETIVGQFVRPRFYMLLLGIFAAVATALAAVGIYGVVNYSVARRTHEIGVRLALGAAYRDILALVIGQGLRLAAIGGALGMLAAIGLTRFLRTLLFGVEPLDPATFAVVAVVLAAIAGLASYVPARRASAVDPMTAVRTE